MRRTGAVVLAAGASRRLGEAKQLVVVGGERLLERAVRVAGEAGCAPVVVVLGARGSEIEAGCDLRGAQVVVNEHWAEGMASSLRLGVGAMPADVDGCVVLACDQPAVTAEHLRLLMERGEDAVASAYAGRQGVPACFAREVFGELMKLSGDRGARGTAAGCCGGGAAGWGDGCGYGGDAASGKGAVWGLGLCRRRPGAEAPRFLPRGESVYQPRTSGLWRAIW